MPSVLGLSSRAWIVREVACTHVDLSKAMCIFGLSTKVRPSMCTLLEFSKGLNYKKIIIIIITYMHMNVPKYKTK